ncbi:Zinc finger, PHD-type [Melia azedarach]|uniref:Zinc finger, PHD-type n=1 Tax=Melia azedarach TaxID=155640 RepID=A0ACC1Z090_MELAZ|nr:Zinc finger, PHD-type [Melia azedarach]
MRKGKFRNVKELYGSNGETLEPKITQVLDGIHQIQWPVGEIDETGCIPLLNKGTERGHGQRDYPNFDLKEEFRTCCICDTSCCMHSRRVKSPMGTKAGEFSDACQGKDVNGHSLDDADLLLPSLGCTRIRRHHTRSETSSLVNACSSPDSFLENVESKACLRASATSEDTHQKVAQNNSFAGASKFDNDQICSNQHKHQKESECLGDNISSMSELCHRNVVACNHDGNMEMKNESCSAASVNSFPVIETPVNVEPASCYMLNSVSGKVDNNDRRKREEFTNESPQAIAGLF